MLLAHRDLQAQRREPAELADTRLGQHPRHQTLRTRQTAAVELRRGRLNGYFMSYISR